MLDWNALIPEKAGPRDMRPEVSRSVPEESTSVPVVSGQDAACNGAASSRFFSSVPVVPGEYQRTEKDPVEIAKGAAWPQEIRAELKQEGKSIYRANPAAVLLLMAWANVKETTR
jgi:hypothetical protein